MPSTTILSGAAPAWVGDRLNGSEHAGTVLHAGSDAVYVLSFDDVIGVTSRFATSIPCTISTRLRTLGEMDTASGTPAIGSKVKIGGGTLDFGSTQVRVGRFLDFSMRPIAAESVPQMTERLKANTGETPQSDEIGPEVLAQLRNTPLIALKKVIGRGSGLTPFGDDVVCGMIATLRAAADPCAGAIGEAALELARSATTGLSTTLLRRAAAGDALVAFRDVVESLAHNPDHVEANIDRLRSIGHTSGSGMLLGLHLALDHVSSRSC